MPRVYTSKSEVFQAAALLTLPFLGQYPDTDEFRTMRGADMVFNNVILRVKESQHVAEVASLLEEQARLSSAEPGCESFVVYHSETEPELFLLIEAWESQQHLAQHPRPRRLRSSICLGSSRWWSASRTCVGAFGRTKPKLGLFLKPKMESFSLLTFAIAH